MTGFQTVLREKLGDKVDIDMSYYIGKDYSIDDLAELVDNNPFSFESISTYPYKVELAYVLVFYGIENVSHDFGKGALAFIVKNLDCDHSYDIIPKQVKTRLSTSGLFDFKLFDVARSAFRLTNDSLNKVDDYIMKNYELLDKVRNIDYSNFEDLILKNSLVNISDKRMADYSVETAIPLTAGGRHPAWSTFDSNVCYDVFIDGIFGSMLKYKDKPAAIVSFKFENNYLKMTQFQGLNPYLIAGISWRKIKKDDIPRGTSRGLVVMNHKDFLFDLGCFVADELEENIAIQSAHNNKWTKPDCDGKIHLPLDKAIKIYDDFAKEKGFIQSQDLDWYKN